MPRESGSLPSPLCEIGSSQLTLTAQRGWGWYSPTTQMGKLRAVCVCVRETERERKGVSGRGGRTVRGEGGREKQKREGGTEWGGEGERDRPVAAPRLQTRTPSETPALTWAGCWGSGHRRESPTLALPLEAPIGKGGPCVGTLGSELASLGQQTSTPCS